MPDQNPSNAPDGVPAAPSEETRTAAIAGDAKQDGTSGGNPLSAAAADANGATPNTPITAPVPDDAPGLVDGQPAVRTIREDREAAKAAADAPAQEPHPSSR